MSDQRPTPETDAAWDAVSRTPSGMYDPTIPYSSYAHAMANLAKKLERQRDEARDALSGRTVSCSQCNQVAVERDEARELARELRDALEAVIPYIVGDRIVPWKAAETALAKAQITLPEK